MINSTRLDVIVHYSKYVDNLIGHLPFSTAKSAVTVTVSVIKNWVAKNRCEKNR